MAKYKYSEIEQEAINLEIINESIDSTVNYEVFEVRGDSTNSEIYFHTAIHQRFFNIILLDFLSNTDENLTGLKKSCLDILREICSNPRFNKDEKSIEKLRFPVDILKNWLEQQITVPTWLPSIDKNIKLNIRRIEFIKICGNISKHHFARLTKQTSKNLINIFKRNEIDITQKESLMILDDFYTRFHDDIFNYYGSILAEMINNIRWGIHEYLLPEFNRSILYDEETPFRYEYRIPRDIVTEFGKSCYFNLMNKTRSGPYVKRFEATNCLTQRY
jgi:hypothetical protein